MTSPNSNAKATASAVALPFYFKSAVNSNLEHMYRFGRFEPF